jgi:GDSL-like Lipase/Acylhydrolase family
LGYDKLRPLERSVQHRRSRLSAGRRGHGARVRREPRHSGRRCDVRSARRRRGRVACRRRGTRAAPDRSPQDTACRRSIDAYAVDLANANNWQVTNLACSGATIQAGLLGPQQTCSQTLPPQLASPAVAKATTLVVSIGANDVTWSSLLRACAALPTCQDQAEEAYFQQQLAA